MARDKIPQLNSAKDGMGINTFYIQDVDELYNLGYRRVRLGGTWPIFAPSAPTAIPTDIIAFRAKGFYVEKGVTYAKNAYFNTPALSATSWPGYHDYTLSVAINWYQYGLNTFMIGNEFEFDYGDGWTQTDLFDALMQLAADIHAVCPNYKIVYNGRANGMQSWIDYIALRGALPAYFQLGFNIYGSGDTDSNNFQGQVNQVVALGGYVSEWSVYYDWTQVTTDQELQKQRFITRKGIIDAANLDNYFHVWKYDNPNEPTFFSDWSVKYQKGTSQQLVTTSWGTRKLIDALVPRRNKVQGITSKSLNFDGTAYATCPLTPAGAGFSVMFWYNRLALNGGETYIIGNANPAAGYHNGFRLYHNGGRGIVFSQLDDNSNLNFNVITSIPFGVWMHFAITIFPVAGGALFYINGNPVGYALPGFIGTPVQNITIGARAGDNAEKTVMGVWDLVVRNGAAFTSSEILAHINSRAVPSGSSWYEFGTSMTQDQSGNGRHLTVTNTTQKADVDQLYLIPNRSATLTRGSIVAPRNLSA